MLLVRPQSAPALEGLSTSPFGVSFASDSTGGPSLSEHAQCVYSLRIDDRDCYCVIGASRPPARRQQIVDREANAEPIKRLIHHRVFPIEPVELVGAGVSLLFLAAFGWFFLRTRMGIAMRAVADSQQVAMAMGINVQRRSGWQFRREV